MTAAALCYPHGYEYPNAPSNTFEYGLTESGDQNGDMMTIGKPLVGAFNGIVDDPVIKGLECAGQPVSCPIRVNIGGDQAMTGSMNCISGCNGYNPCAKCYVPKTEMCQLDLAKVKAYKAR